MYLLFVREKERERENTIVYNESFPLRRHRVWFARLHRSHREINGTSLLNRPTRQYQLKLHSRTMPSSTRTRAKPIDKHRARHRFVPWLLPDDADDAFSCIPAVIATSVSVRAPSNRPDAFDQLSYLESFDHVNLFIQFL